MNVVNLAGNPTADPVESTYTYKDKDGVQGHLKSGNFERDGVKQYTLDLIVDCIEFCQKVTEEKENTEFVEMSENAQNEFFSVPEPGENDLPMPY